MPLPENFSPPEFLQDITRRVINQEVREWFRDVGPDDWDPDISTARGALRVGCTHLENDSHLMTVHRLLLFYLAVRKAQDLQASIYGIPSTAFQARRKFKPQIQLYFREDLNDVDAGYSPLEGEISFRIMGEEYDTLSRAEALNYANRIKTLFAIGPGFVWRKGKVMCTYTDWNRGYQLQLLCRDKAEGKRVVEQVLDIQQHTPDWKKFNVSENDEPSQAYPTIPPLEVIMGESVRMPRSRPIGDVRFRNAVLIIHGKPNPLALIDTEQRYSNPLAS